MSGSGWCTIESDPGVFTELIASMGVKDVQVEELVSLDAEELSRLKPVYGLVFLFKWQQGVQTAQRAIEDAPQIYFARQVITNACATQAMLSILMNQGDAVDIGDDLRNLRDFTGEFDPELKGVTLTNADAIRLAHNSFSPPEASIAEAQQRTAGDDDDVYHFISYVYRDGAIWELDGLQAGPIKHVECTQEEWLHKIGDVIGQRIAAYESKEIRFNLMALVQDRRTSLRHQLEQLESSMDTEATPESDASALDLQDQLASEEHKHEKWRNENIRRKHNYIPLIFNMAKLLAERGELRPLIDAAKAKAASK